jgi:hypothetical protein
MHPFGRHRLSGAFTPRVGAIFVWRERVIVGVGLQDDGRIGLVP